jgi:hypothetical protein
MDKRHTPSGKPGAADSVISEYVDELSRQLRRRLPGAQANEIAEETESHLRDRVDELVRGGATTDAAHAAALAGFGPPAVYAEQVAASVVETKWSRLADRLRRPLYAVVFVLPICSVVVDLDARYAGHLVLLYELYGFVLALASALGCSIGSRRPAPSGLLAFGGVMLLGGIAFAAFDKTTLPNSSQLASRILAAQNIEYTQRAIGREQTQIRLLREGMAVYAAGTINGVPSDLRVGHSYLAPLDPTYVTADATRVYLPEQGVQPFQAIASVTSKTTDRGLNIMVRCLWGQESSVLTLQEARTRWRSAAPTWLLVSQQSIASEDRYLRNYQAVQSQPMQFRPDLITWDDLWIAPFTAILVALDAVAALLGRWAFLRRRQDRLRGLPS